jgi:putative ABC transport system permease protein
MGSFWQDLRYAAQQLGKNPGVTVIMVFTLALGIGATTAIFSVVYGVLLRQLPYSGADRIMAVSEVNFNGRPSRLADPNFDDFRDQSHSFQSLAKYSAYPVSVSGAAQPTRTTVAAVTPQFLTVFGVEPIMGRDFTASDNQKGSAPVALVSYGYWRQNLGSAQDLSQAHLKINNAVYSVIGVLPSGFRFPDDVNVWFAADIKGENVSRTSHNYDGVGRLKDGVSVAQARDDIRAIARRIYQTNDKSDYLLRDGSVVPLQDSITGTVRSPLLILLSAVGFLLLVACANVANLLLAQASVRERELAIRGALGAARGRLVRQFLTEAFLLSLIGGVVGVLAALWGVAGLVALAPEQLPRLDSVSVTCRCCCLRFCCALGWQPVWARSPLREPRESI